MELIVAQASIIPVGTGSTSISSFVAEAVKTLKKSELNIMITPMGTLIEAEDLESIFKAIEECHEALHKIGVKRIYTLVLIDDRRDVERNMADKVRSVEEKLGCSSQHDDSNCDECDTNKHKEEA